MFYAQEEAQKYGEGFVSTEHLLLGIVREDDSVAVRVLVVLGVTPERVRAEVEKHLSGNDGRPNPNMTLTPRAKRVIDLAYDQARSLSNNYIGTEHLLLGIIKEEDGIGGRALKALGVTLADARRETEAIQAQERKAGNALDPSPAKPTPVAPPADPWAGIDPFARRAIVFAEMEALRRGQPFLSPEHLFLGLLREPESAAVRALLALDADLDAVHSAVALHCRDSGTPLRSEAVLSPATANAIRIAYQEQIRLRAKETGAEHLLLGLLREPDGVVGHVMEGLGLDADRVRAAIVRVAVVGD